MVCIIYIADGFGKKKEKPKLNSSSQPHFSTKKECSENDKLHLFLLLLTFL